jgi:large subunit ribosomal protein L3
VPVTVVEAGPCPVVQVKTVETDGYNAVQLGFGAQKAKNASKAETSHAKKAGLASTPRVLNEVRLAEAFTGKAGDVITVSAFSEGQIIDVLGVSKGKGFQGVMKKHGASGGPAAHGSMFHRRIGSIGMRQTPGRSWKNQAMPGHMGSNNRTVQNLRVVKILADKNLILVKGAIPGANGDDVIIRSGKKAKKA